MLAAVTAAETTGKPGTLSGCTLLAGVLRLPYVAENLLLEQMGT